MHEPRVPVSLGDTLGAYDLWSQAYDTFDNPLIAMTEHALDAAPLQLAGRRVLELGCGTGRNARRLLALGATSYVGVDGSPGMLERARAQLEDPRAHWLQADLASPVPLADGCADEVLLCLVLEHVPQLGPLFQEVHRLLAPGGRVRGLEIHPRLVQAGTQAHFWHEGREYRLASFPHTAQDFVAALSAAGLEPAALCEWYGTQAAEAHCAKLRKHRGLPVVLDVRASRP
ncbi:MAG TPA: class I SAM-dependent methyltransferase [Longimicrobiaceae bacterium]|nr:class I SAM-dependent methyltransferase [Longimicrobiaceae bacterium]